LPTKDSPPHDSLIDAGIADAVQVLRASGVETTESCQGGEGHAFSEPIVRFLGDKPEGLRALSVALENGLQVAALRRSWSIIDGEPVGPMWEMTFWRNAAGSVRAGSVLD
jgi:hypothetical protein